MNTINKLFDMSTLSSSCWDHVRVVQHLLLDGKTEILRRLPARTGGLGSNGLAGIRCIPGRLALGTLVGDDQAGSDYRNEIHRLGICADYIVKVDGARTNENQVYQANGARAIYKDTGVTFPDTMPLLLKERFTSMTAKSRSLMVGNIPLEWTITLGEWARKTQTLFAVAPGSHQLDHLDEIECDLLVLNHDESRQVKAAEENDHEDPEKVFRRLLAVSPADHVIQTGGGEHPAYLYDRSSDRAWSVEPADLNRLGKPKMPCGTGDVAACAALRSLVEGHPLDLAYAKWGRGLATAHLLGRSFPSVTAADRWFDKHAAAFPPAVELSPQPVTKAA